MRFAERQRDRGAEHRVIHQVSALVLCYPDQALLEQVPLLREAISATSAAADFAPVFDHLEGGHPTPTAAPGGLEVRFPGEQLLALQAYHVQEFDLSRRHALHLTYWTEGDTRRRGEVLAAIKQVYRDSGLRVDTGGELPDFLPMMLEFAAADPARGIDLLSAHRPSLELLRLGLLDDHLPHAGLLAAICRTLPGPSPQSRAEVLALVKAIAPVETVGLEPYGDRAFLGLPTLQRS